MDLGIQTLTPQLHSVITKLQDWAQKLNSMNKNSCDTAKAGIAAIQAYTEGTSSDYQQCRDNYVEANYSWAEATEKCNDSPKVSLDKQLSNGTANKDTVMLKNNIVWNQLMKISTFKSDTEWAEMLMSLSGTVIYDADGNRLEKPSLAKGSDALLKALMTGGEFQYYKCDTTKEEYGCLNPTLTTSSIDASKAMVAKTKDFIEALATSLSNDTAPTASEQSFLEYTSIPVLRLLSSILESHDAVDSYEKEYAQIIAADIVSKFLRSMIAGLDIAMSSSKAIPDDLTPLRSNMDTLLEEFTEYPRAAQEKLIAQYNLIEQRKSTDKYIQAQMASIINSAAY